MKRIPAPLFDVLAREPWKRGWYVSAGNMRCASTPTADGMLPCLGDPIRIPAGSPIFLTGTPGEVFCEKCARAFLPSEDVSERRRA